MIRGFIVIGNGSSPPAYRCQRFPVPEFPRIHALHPVEEAGEGGDFGEMELVGNLGDAQRGLAQKESGLHQQHLVDIVDNGAAT